VDSEIEIRQVFELEDFASNLTDEERRKKEQFREELAKR
jgi:hypothetical protein